MEELKKLLFSPPFPDNLFNGKKRKTFRVTGGERFDIGDKLSLCYTDGEEFAKAVVSGKYIKRFIDLSEKDWEGHERFDSEKEMYERYSEWEGFEVGPKTKLYIIEYKRFELTGNPRVD